MKKVSYAFMKNTPVIILVRPQLAENMGMVARAMMNCALSELRIVSPRDNHLSKKAVSAASGAAEILNRARVYQSLCDAVKDRQIVYAATARPRNMTKPVLSPVQAVENIEKAENAAQKTAILFGPERTGLENEELICANAIVEIPLNPLHCSLNLSQAVLLMGYEWFKKRHISQNTRLETGGSILAGKGEVEIFLTHLERELRLRGYFRFTDKESRMQHNLRNIFTRMPLTHAEIKTLHGMISDLIRSPAK